MSAILLCLFRFVRLLGSGHKAIDELDAILAHDTSELAKQEGVNL